MTDAPNIETKKPLLEVKNLKKSFPIKKGFLRRTVGQVHAVDDVSFSIAEGETVSLVGESGCGKTTTVKSIMRAINPDDGQVLFRTSDDETVDLADLSLSEIRPYRRNIQMIFQDPFSSLNPRMNIFQLISEPLVVNRVGSHEEREDRVSELLRQVGLRPEYMQRFPHAFSGGQRQRIGIARALAMNPRLIVADEPVSGLDVSVQAQVLNLMMDLQDELGLTYLFVTHDLSVVNQISDRVVGMYVGRVVEVGTPQELFHNPKHPYTSALISALPITDPKQRGKRPVLQGEIANPSNPPSGCYFHPRCPFAVDLCKVEAPPLQKSSSGRLVSCHRVDEIELVGATKSGVVAG